MDLNILKVVKTKTKDEDYIFQHSVNTRIISAMIGKLLGFSKEDCHLLSEMGLFHDIGMLKLDSELLDKTGPLTHKEFLIVQEHTNYGYDVIKTLPKRHSLVSRAALLHHERLDGSGYPSKLLEKKIPLFIQIITVADCFNAMSMKRNYGVQKSHFNGVYELMSEAAANKMNPAIIVPFVKYIMRQHLHDYVILSNNEKAKIIFIHEHEPHQPLVKIDENDYIDLRKESTIKILNLA